MSQAEPAGTAGPGDGAGTGPAEGASATATVIGEAHGCPVVDSLGAAVVHTDRDRYHGLLEGLRADGYDLFVGLTGVDYLTHPGRDLPAGVAPERFEVVVELWSIAARRRLRVRCQVPGADPWLPTAYDVWAGAEAHERETYDLFGVRFEGHPDPSRILMPEDWEGHPLRKDYATGHIPVRFKESPDRR